MENGKLFRTTLKDGKWNQRDFDEEKITVLTMLRQKAIQNMHSTSTDARREKCKPCIYVSGVDKSWSLNVKKS